LVELPVGAVAVICGGRVRRLFDDIEKGATFVNPGHGIVCRQCVNLLANLRDQGHVNPCELVGWENTKHHAPALSDDGRSCGGFEPKEEEPVDVETAATA